MGERPLRFIGRQSSLFIAQHEASKALFTHESARYRYSWKFRACLIKSGALSQNLTLREAQDEETRLRILTIRGTFEVNYDAATAPQHLANGRGSGTEKDTIIFSLTERPANKVSQPRCSAM